ncbi:MAG: hypothetical protein A3G00_04245 [Candidatus Magasanikbacteria bacterium RIFCSPLOWO2_12_FULL_43_12]|uniref:Uncharacterized protein n=1 Tax=Candidatus Magasanikbacteria bacterium RIFCSPLOWO2_12_FULL_43_12 TaxID=1798692 RepID=A0A1F6MW72_9BACT|nr:MAG: hypothetical protein A3I93_04135 [Candidatus Magasanikbacteria bacterium RIFCSPLOWO2_02_FULL_43_22]OGH75673.1 MAG: hypothetical protein A3G00_04245 [Candidatus Magasanikbacteria bacterium RIFCSPLOWO2_12_FULL_43_12]
MYNLSTLARKMGYNFNETNDERVIKMKKEIDTIGSVEFKIEQYPDGSWTAESTNFDGIITGGTSTQNISSSIKDAIFTYFKIPAYLCNDILLRGNNEPITIKQNVYA